MPATLADLTPSASGPFLRLVKIRNFKSIEGCHVRLGPLTVLVGRNGSGKSNFLDALRFITDSLRTSLDHAIRDRGGIAAVRRRSMGHPRNFALEIEIRLPVSLDLATYSFEIAARKDGGFVVKREKLTILDKNDRRSIAHYLREDTEVTASSIEPAPPVPDDRLYLGNTAGFPRFDEVFQTLSSMGFYNLNPDRMKEPRSPDAGDLLHRDGGNIASVVGRLHAHRPEIMERITAYLQAIVPGVTDVGRIPLGPSETLQFRQRVKGAKDPWKFYASSMSDGTLRALAGLVAVMQFVDRKRPVNLVGIEEPETALHPAAAGALMEALREATDETQVVVTSHSPDLAREIVPGDDQFLVVAAKNGVTRIAPADTASREAIKKHLYDAGELLRMDQLEPDAEDLERQKRQLRLFDHEVEAA